MVIGSTGLFAVLALTLTWLPDDEVILIAVTYIALSSLWLAAGVLFLLNQIHWYGMGLAIGVGLSLFAMWAGGRSGLSAGGVMLGATVVGLAAALVVMALAARRALARRAAVSAVANKRVTLAPTPQLVFGLAPYFIYGVAYVVLILVRARCGVGGQYSEWFGSDVGDSHH